MSTVDDVLRIARNEVGTVESPPNSNRTKYGRAYGLDANPWCAMFVWWVMNQAHEPMPVKTAWVPSLVTAYKRTNRFFYKPRIGDIVFYEFGSQPDHCGIVEQVGSQGILAIEGNTSIGNDTNGGAVMVRSRPFSAARIVGYGRPEYREAVAPMFNPALVVEDIVAFLKMPDGGVHLLARSGAVYSFGTPHLGTPHGKPYFAGRRAALIEEPNDEERRAGRKYTVIATTGERYSYPED